MGGGHVWVQVVEARMYVWVVPDHQTAVLKERAQSFLLTFKRQHLKDHFQDDTVIEEKQPGPRILMVKAADA